MSATIIERETETGQYGHSHDVMVVEHPEHGRLLLVEGFGGMDAPRGGAYRWEHGAVYRLQPNDTLASLRESEWNEWTNLYEATVHGYDDTRPPLDWSGVMVQSLAEHAVHA